MEDSNQLVHELSRVDWIYLEQPSPHLPYAR